MEQEKDWIQEAIDCEHAAHSGDRADMQRYAALAIAVELRKIKELMVLWVDRLESCLETNEQEAKRLNERFCLLEEFKAAHMKLDEHGANTHHKNTKREPLTLAERIEDLQRQAWALGSREGWRNAEAEARSPLNDTEEAAT